MRKPFPLLAMLATMLVAMAMPALAQVAPSMTAPPGLSAALMAAMLGIAPMLVPAINAPLVAGITELLKRAPAVPFEAKTVTTLILALGAISTVTTVLCDLAIAWLSGNAMSFDVANAVKVLGQAALSVLTAAGAFGLFKKAQA